MNSPKEDKDCIGEIGSAFYSLYNDYFIKRSTSHIILLELAALVGLVVALAGYRFIKIAMFFTGFTLAFAAFYVFSPSFIDTKYCCTRRGLSQVHVAVSVLVGAVAGLIVTRLYRIGVFIIGKCLGLLIALLLLHTPINLYLKSFSEVGSFLTLSAVVAGSFTLRYEKPFAILSTSFFGTYVGLCGVDVFVKSAFSFSLYALINFMKENASLDNHSQWFSEKHLTLQLHLSKCWTSRNSIIMFSIWLGSSLLCCLFQYQVTAKNLSEGGKLCPFNLCACICGCCTERKSQEAGVKGK